MPAVAPSTRSCHLQLPHHTPGTEAWRRLDTVRPRIRLRASSQETSSSPRADCSSGLRRRGRRVLLTCSLGGGRAKVHAGGGSSGSLVGWSPCPGRPQKVSIQVRQDSLSSLHQRASFEILPCAHEKLPSGRNVRGNMESKPQPSTSHLFSDLLLIQPTFLFCSGVQLLGCIPSSRRSLARSERWPIWWPGGQHA